tara:strand:+ start:261 stop:596 length:336 start_codon:yes stop_codon:yes gene_type:complete
MRSIPEILAEEGPVVKVVVLKTDGSKKEELFDMTPMKNTLGKYLNDSVTFIGQYEETQVVITKGLNSTDSENKNVLPAPFNDEKHNGDIVLIRMDDDAIPQDFTLDEYELM